ncbi:MAG: SDR family oxidoreductase [Actinomycetota bacterium]
MGRLDNKVCLITGAARGQGESEARIFAEEGATVWLTDVLDAEGQAVAADMGGTYRSLDVRDEAAWAGLVEEITAEHGGIDVLVNNAGIYTNGRHFEIDVDDFNKVMDINCTGVFLGMRAVSPVMRDAGQGSIVNISSVAGMQGGNGAFAYFTSKWAVRGMTKAAAVENGRRNVRVNSIHPGLIETNMLNDAVLEGQDPARTVNTYVPMGRTATADEVARMALFLASEESSYCTGCEFVVDGGMTAL